MLPHTGILREMAATGERGGASTMGSKRLPRLHCPVAHMHDSHTLVIAPKTGYISSHYSTCLLWLQRCG